MIKNKQSTSIQAIGAFESAQKILVVEDDPSLCEILEELFISCGYEIEISHGIADITTLLPAFNPDLIILDYLLPLVNGGELCRQVKKHALYADLPVVIFSAYPKVMMSIGTYGSDAFIEKPFNLSDLIDLVKSLLAHKDKSSTR